ncbi:hypothetical protein [Aquimarina rubra]|uniref:DUF4468 domain-containing protein n=1 Tax=Aquimarina rubra TaxID=1920033 RepID=A0ABW5LCM2_9FLAO
MKKVFALVLFSIGQIVSGQENNPEQIDSKVNVIESNTELSFSEFDWVELTGIVTDGGGVLKIWSNDDTIHKIIEEIGFSYGRLTTTIYLSNQTPIKIIETEENFERTNDGFKYSVLEEVFRKEYYVFDWEREEGETNTIGKRFMSEEGCSNYEIYDPILERAKKAITK